MKYAVANGKALSRICSGGNSSSYDHTALPLLGKERCRTKKSLSLSPKLRRSSRPRTRRLIQTTPFRGSDASYSESLSLVYCCSTRQSRIILTSDTILKGRSRMYSPLLGKRTETDEDAPWQWLIYNSNLLHHPRASKSQLRQQLLDQSSLEPRWSRQSWSMSGYLVGDMWWRLLVTVCITTTPRRCDSVWYGSKASRWWETTIPIRDTISAGGGREGRSSLSRNSVEMLLV